MVWAADANEEIAQYLDSVKSVIDTDLRFVSGAMNYLQAQVLHCLTYLDD